MLLSLFNDIFFLLGRVWKHCVTLWRCHVQVQCVGWVGWEVHVDTWLEHNIPECCYYFTSNRIVCCFDSLYEGCSIFFHLETTSSLINKLCRQTLANPMFIFSGTCCPTLVEKTLMCDLLKFVPGVCSPVTLHSAALHLNIYVLL